MRLASLGDSEILPGHFRTGAADAAYWRFREKTVNGNVSNRRTWPSSKDEKCHWMMVALQIRIFRARNISTMIKTLTLSKKYRFIPYKFL